MTQRKLPPSPATRAYFQLGGMGTRCRCRRRELGITIAEVARRDGERVIRPEFVEELEHSGNGEPPEALNFAEALAIADALECNPRWLIFGDEPPRREHPAVRRRKPRRRHHAPSVLA